MTYDGRPINDYTPNPRELDLLAALADGRTSTAIAEERGVTRTAPATQLRRLRQRLGIGPGITDAGLVALAFRRGWLR